MTIDHEPSTIHGMKTSSAQNRVKKVLARLKKTYPNAHCELNYSGNLQLAIAAILSAQCTDKRVNVITPPLFKKYTSASDWAKTPQATLENEIRSAGFFRNKAKNIRALCAALEEKHGGEIPGDFETLVNLPGIGRKTANLLMGEGFGKPGMIVDTHCKRVSYRLGFTKHSEPTKVERDLRKIVPEKDWTHWSHCMVFHGRYCCFARRPNCPNCSIKNLCPSYETIMKSGKVKRA